MDALAAKCFHDHQNPLVKVETPAKKFFLAEGTQNERDAVEKCLNKQKETLNFGRVERRCARAKAIWLENKGLAKVTKFYGSFLGNFGYQDKDGKFLFPEEIVFLVESNKLELEFQNRTITIKECYDIILKSCPLKNYLVYKKLINQGYKLLRTKSIRKFYKKNAVLQEITKDTAEDLTLKRKRSDTIENLPSDCFKKITQIEVDNENMSALSDKNEDVQNTILSIFENLRRNSPKPFQQEHFSKVPDFFGFLPNSTQTHRHDFNLFIRENFNKFEDFGKQDDVTNIVALYSNENISFYRFANINLPTLT